MSQSAFFNKLGAPLKNIQWSWGSVNMDKKTVYMKVWQDEIKQFGDKHFCLIVKDVNSYAPSNLGFKERMQHIEMIKSGYACYLIMCHYTGDIKNKKRISKVNELSVFKGGEIIEAEGSIWIEYAGRVPVSSLGDSDASAVATH